MGAADNAPSFPFLLPDTCVPRSRADPASLAGVCRPARAGAATRARARRRCAACRRGRTVPAVSPPARAVRGDHGRPADIRRRAPCLKARSAASARTGRVSDAATSPGENVAHRRAPVRSRHPIASCRRRRMRAIRRAWRAGPHRKHPAGRVPASIRAGNAHACAVAADPPSTARPTGQVRRPPRKALSRPGPGRAARRVCFPARCGRSASRGATPGLAHRRPSARCPVRRSATENRARAWPHPAVRRAIPANPSPRTAVPSPRSRARRTARCRRPRAPCARWRADSAADRWRAADRCDRERHAATNPRAGAPARNRATRHRNGCGVAIASRPGRSQPAPHDWRLAAPGDF